MYVWEITRRQKDGGAEQSHLFIGELQTTEAFSKVKHGTDQVVTPCTDAGCQKQHRDVLEHGEHMSPEKHASMHGTQPILTERFEELSRGELPIEENGAVVDVENSAHADQQDLQAPCSGGPQTEAET